MDPLVIAGKRFTSRLFAGTGKFGSHVQMRQALDASGTQLVTVALRRVDLRGGPAAQDDLLTALRGASYDLLPNTSGARNAKEAILAAELAREALGTNWLKLEIHPNPRHLMPDGEETLNAAKDLVKRGFIVLPYVHADPILCKKLEDCGCAAVMPLAAPIGSNAGLSAKRFLEIIIAEAQVPVVVDAGLGAPSHAAAAMELGASAVLINTAMAAAADPIAMARAFALAVEAGRLAFVSGLAPRPEGAVAAATSPLTAFLGQE